MIFRLNDFTNFARIVSSETEHQNGMLYFILLILGYLSYQLTVVRTGLVSCKFEREYSTNAILKLVTVFATKSLTVEKISSSLDMMFHFSTGLIMKSRGNFFIH